MAASQYADANLVQQRCGVTAADLGMDAPTFTAFLSSLNDRASAAIEDYCKRDFLPHSSVTESYDGTDDALLDLRGWPVTALTSVQDTGVALTQGIDYRLKPGVAGGEAPGILERNGDVWTKGWNRYTVTYSWGYSSPPLDVKRVAEDLMVRVLQAAKADTEAAGAASVSMDGFSTTYDRAALAGQLTGDDKAALAKWRFLRVG